MTDGSGMDVNELVAHRIRDLRIEQRLRQVDLASAAGMSRAVVLGIESGRRKVTVDEACRLAMALGVTIRQLLVGIRPEVLDALGFSARHVAQAIRPILPLLGRETYDELRRTFDTGGQGLPDETVAVLAWLFRYEPAEPPPVRVPQPSRNEPVLPDVDPGAGADGGPAGRLAVTG
jgi:transcriptional regulator with XRE-family HTH domain